MFKKFITAGFDQMPIKTLEVSVRVQGFTSEASKQTNIRHEHDD